MRCRFVLILSLSALTAGASSIELTSVNSGVYNYALRLDPGEFNQFASNAIALSLSGMSGVISESVNDVLDFCLHGVPVTASTANLVADSPAGCGINNPLVSSVDDGSWFVVSTSTTTGLVNYTITTTQQTFSGQVLGPVAGTPVPEPSSAVAVALGIAVLAWWKLERKRLRRAMLIAVSLGFLVLLADAITLITNYPQSVGQFSLSAVNFNVATGFILPPGDSYRLETVTIEMLVYSTFTGIDFYLCARQQ